jgi:murein DD-endopeptidase MepM/ murein hydrolase activator NlpD
VRKIGPSKRFCLPTQRGRDGYGSGKFGASRGSRRHNGLDIAVAQGTPIYAPEAARVVSTSAPVYSNPDKAHKRLVHLMTEDGVSHLLMYVRAAQGLRAGAKVEAGDLIGYAQGLQDIYPGITDHIHWEVRMPETRIDPVSYLIGES